MKQNLDRILCLFFFISNKRVNRFVINVFFSLTKGSFLLRRLFMQTKNMRLLKASVLCLSIALLKQTGHAGLEEEIAGADFTSVSYSGVETLGPADINPYSYLITAIRADWLIADQVQWQQNTPVLSQQRDSFATSFSWALTHLQHEITNNSLPYLTDALTAIASEKFEDVKDVDENEVHRVLRSASKTDMLDIYKRCANLIVQKALFECAKVAQKVSKAKPQEQPGLLGLIACNMQQSGLSQNLVLNNVFKTLSESLQQSSASAASASASASGQPQQETTAEKQLKALGAKWAGAVVPQDQMQQEMQQAFDLARNISQIPGRNTPALQTILKTVEAGLTNQAYKNDPAGAVNHYCSLQDILRACDIPVSSDAVDGAPRDESELIRL